jgi:hypothetical protein
MLIPVKNNAISWVLPDSGQGILIGGDIRGALRINFEEKVMW